MLPAEAPLGLSVADDIALGLASLHDPLPAILGGPARSFGPGFDVRSLLRCVRREGPASLLHPIAVIRADPAGPVAG